MTTNWALVALVVLSWGTGVVTGLYYAAKHNVVRRDLGPLA